MLKYALRHYLPPLLSDDGILFRDGDEESSMPHASEEGAVDGYDADWENIEIMSEIQERALYFFYLRHPEGVLLRRRRRAQEHRPQPQAGGR